jgi:TetR/AcrR family acrAB operon transcriptional repressor
VARRTKEEAQETRNRILDAAELVFHREGVSRTSLADIAAEAGVTRGAIYWHFEDKAHLFEAMMQRLIEPLEARLAELQGQPEGNPLAGLRDLVLFFVERVAASPAQQRVLEIAWHKCEYVGEMAEIRDRHLECGNRHLDIMEAAMRLAQRRGYLPAEVVPRQAAVGLMALTDGLVVNWTLDRKLFPLARYAAPIVDAYLRGLQSPAATARPAKARAPRRLVRAA